MKFSNKINKIYKTQKELKQKLVSEGLTKKEMTLLNEINSFISEAPMMFGPEVGGARPSRTLQQKIEKGELPLSKFGLTQAQVDFFTSEAFKDSIVKLESLLGEYSGIDRRLTTANQNLKTDANTAFSTLMSVIGQLMGELVSLQMKNKEELEQIATESVEKAMGIDREFFTKKLELDGKLTVGFLQKLKGMKNKVENISDEEILKKFASIDDEKKKKLEDMRADFESMGAEFDEEKAKEAIETTFQMSPETAQQAKQEFSDEVSRRMIINMFRRGMSLYYTNAYDICMDKITDLPDGERIIQISNVLQPIMLHMYWLFPDIGGIGSGGGGQIGQVQVKGPQEEGDSEDEDSDEEPQQTPQQQGPFKIIARAGTLPLLIHELVKGTIMFFTSAGGGKTEGQRVLAKQAATSLEIEAYDLVYSEKFYKEFYKIYSKIVPDVNEQRELTPFLLKFLSEDTKDNLIELSKSLFTLGLSNPGFAENYIENLVGKSRKLRKQMEQNPAYMKKKEYKGDIDLSDFDDFDID